MISLLNYALPFVWTAIHLSGQVLNDTDEQQDMRTEAHAAEKKTATPTELIDASYEKYRDLSMEELRKLCRTGEIKAVAEYSDRLYWGKGVDKDEIKASHCFRCGALRGDVKCQHGLARCLLNGKGVEQNRKEAVTWYRKAAEKQYARSQLVLGYCYQDGDGVDRDERIGFEWIRKAAMQGLADAQESLAAAFFNSTGVAVDRTQAAHWWKLAADQGQVCAVNNLGTCYSRGLGVKFNRRRAEGWFTRAAEQGNEHAAENLKALASQPDPSPRSIFPYQGWPGGFDRVTTPSGHMRQAAERQAAEDTRRFMRDYRNNMSGQMGAMEFGS